MRFVLFAFIVLCTTLGCKEKKVDLSGNSPIEIKDFMAAFPALPLPFVASDTNINRLSDSLIIGIKVLQQFIPDTVTAKIIGTEQKVIIQPVGKLEKENETYLLATFTQNKKVQLVTFVLNKSNVFLAWKELLNTKDKDGYLHSVSINKEPTFSVAREKMNREKQLLQYTRVGWAFSTSIGSFVVVVNETNEDEKKNNEILNPIDTLGKKNKWSGNYVQDSKNFISIRDGKDANNYLFFIHFKKNDGTCNGELKGDLKLKSPTEGIYSENGDGCIIDFQLVENEIIVKEQGSCGNYRGITCYFDDSYKRKKEVVVKKKK